MTKKHITTNELQKCSKVKIELFDKDEISLGLFDINIAGSSFKWGQNLPNNFSDCSLQGKSAGAQNFCHDIKFNLDMIAQIGDDRND